MGWGEGGNWLQMLFWCCQDLKTAELLCPPIGDMKDWDAILCLNSVQEMLINKVKIHIWKGKIWTWVASTRIGIDSSPKAVVARNQWIRTICFKDKFLSPGDGCFYHPLLLYPYMVGVGEGIAGASKYLFHLVFDGSHSSHGVWLMDEIVHFPYAHMTASLQSCTALCDSMDCSSPLFYPRDFPGKNIVVGCHSFLQGILLTQGSNLLSCVSCTAGGFFTNKPPGKLSVCIHNSRRLLIICI